ncbi:MAG: transcription termination factor Rho [Acidimicrobiales bacterium]
MSVDAHELERGALKRKDREQLLTIASALGRKPPARARKDQIIDLILELSGGSSAAEAGSSGGVTSPASGRAARTTAPAPADAEVPTDAAPAPAVAEPPAPQRPAAERPAAEPLPLFEAQPAAEAPAPVHVASFDPFGDVEGGAPPMRRTRPVEATATGGSGSEGGTVEGGGAAATNGSNGAMTAGVETNGNGAATTERAAVSAGGENAGERTARNDGDGRGEPADRGDGAEGGERGDAGDRGDGQGEREGNSRRRRRRGRDKDRDRQGNPGQGGQGSNQQGDRADRSDRSDRSDRADRSDRSDRDDRDGQGQSSNDPVPVAGFLDLRDEGYGFLRVKGYLPSKEDVYVPAKFVRQFGLRKGDHLDGASRPAGRGEKNPALLRIDEVNGTDPEKARARRRFEELTPLFPDEKLRLEQTIDPANMTARIIDLISPIGKGQRGLIVSPPKAGKTTVMKTIAQCIEANNPEVKLIVLLIDERPEEVTDMKRSVRGEVVASTFDRPADEHTHVVEMTIERAKRMVEQGDDVVIILDGITRLARAYNLAAPATGRIMSGGIDTGALYPPKKFFGAARNVEEGGSLTILATALVETGSRMDEVIFEEFKGTGNMELRLDRRLAEKRIYPAIDVDASSTRHEELLFERRQLNLVWKLRRVLSGLAAEGSAGAGLELLVDRMKTFKSNDEFLAEVAKAPSM